MKREKFMTCGIYMLQFKGTNKVYIGQSINIEKRYREHLTRPKTGKKLQEAFNTYGNPTLLILLDDLTSDELNTAENEAIEIFNSVDNGFNQLYLAGSFPDNSGTANGMSKYSKEEILEAFNLLLDNPNNSAKQISKLTTVKQQTIERIAAGSAHTWLRDIYPTQYKELLSRKGNKTFCTREKLGKPLISLLSPEGNIFKDIPNISEFCREQGLPIGCLTRVANGTRKSSHGWTLYLNN
jgi:group I intron endonuclease